MENNIFEEEEYAYIFVYGTLKRGFVNHYNMKRTGMEFVSYGKTVEKLPLYTDPDSR